MTNEAAARNELSADQRILEIACEQLRLFGAKRTTIVGIAEAANMSHANIYRYFPSKKGLIEAVTALWLKPLEAELRVIVEGQDPAYDKLERALAAVQRAYRHKCEADPILFDLLCEAVVEDGAVARKHRNRVQGEIQKIIEEGIGSGSFRVQDRRRAMALVFDLAHRFIQPVSIALDRHVPTRDLELRAARTFAVIQRSLTSGEPEFYA